MSTKEVADILTEALKGLPDIDKRIVERQPKEKMQQGKKRLASLGASIASAVAGLGGDVDNPDPVTPTGEYWGGDAGYNNRKVVENKVFGAFNAEQYEGMDLLGCRFTKPLYGRCGDKVRFLECTFDLGDVPDVNGHGSHAIYFNNGHDEKEIGLVFDKCKLVGINAVNAFEFKLSDAAIVNCEQVNCKIGQTVRQRHGRKLVCINNKGFTDIAARGWCHYVDNCPSATVVMWSGNLAYRYEDWKDQHIPAGGNNMQGTELMYANGVAAVKLGFYQGDHADYPAKDCIIGPNVGKIVEGNFKNMKRQTLGSYKELWKLAGF